MSNGKVIFTPVGWQVRDRDTGEELASFGTGGAEYWRAKAFVDGQEPLCQATTSGNGFTFICDRPRGHDGEHMQRYQLRDGAISRTVWSDDE
jgi:hypothetical protein